MTYKEISEKYNVTVSTLTGRAFRMKLKPLRYGYNVIFSEEQVKALIEYDPKAYLEKYRKNNDKRKIRIIEFYFKFKTANRTAIFLNLHRDLVGQTIHEYNKLGYIVVASKMNDE